MREFVLSSNANDKNEMSVFKLELIIKLIGARSRRSGKGEM